MNQIQYGFGMKALGGCGCGKVSLRKVSYGQRLLTAGFTQYETQGIRKHFMITELRIGLNFRENSVHH